MNKWNIEYILENYERSLEGETGEKKYLLYPSNSNILVVCFTTLGSNIYERTKLLWEENEEWKYNYLFVSDNSGEEGGLFYIGDSQERIVENDTYKIIEKIIKERNIESVVTLGSSMGGYAAIYYALKYNFLGAISVVPQINKLAIDECGWEKWKRVSSVVSGGEFPDLSKLISQRQNIPNLYVQYGDYIPDIRAIDELKLALNKQTGLYVFDKFEEANHTSKYMTKELIESIIQLFLMKENRKNMEGGVG